jgi:hypothetical protein
MDRPVYPSGGGKGVAAGPSHHGVSDRMDLPK